MSRELYDFLEKVPLTLLEAYIRERKDARRNGNKRYYDGLWNRAMHEKMRKELGWDKETYYLLKGSKELVRGARK